MSRAPSLAILILAAGRSRRMGRDKLMLRRHDGVPLLANRISTALATGHGVFVALPARSPTRLTLVRQSLATPLPCPDAGRGMGHSLAHAIGSLPKGLDGVLVLLADMPALTLDDLMSLSDGFDPDRILRGATQDNAPGHPVLIPARFLSRLSALEGDQGAHHVIADLPTRLIPLPADHARFDVDTPADWQEWLDRSAPS
ncbi:molybdopterin-guanine dinucleotide biosynthesis protein A [Aliiroseovarius zhejiangensis]|uniref:Molybdopterin-guanine dinucleotide biosynthesis protein A n=1 Tax=Aliiroseovarius zhejiangensis TaxID=1632025 RepID=A0ABQ3IV71_9RHOB|nr:nucleotidyltransferase family protein [Aliiroseovarius zhejiangensis]GHE95354.1 molybdopterin-guanine dinucleotide biosynthesis protein A [Aliiroseovarius zhejiangensis]